MDTLGIGGYSVEELPPETLKDRQYAHYRHLDGRVVRLPADPYSLKHYTQKGLVVVTDELNDSVKADKVIGEVPKPVRKPRKKARRKSKKGGKP